LIVRDLPETFDVKKEEEFLMELYKHEINAKMSKNPFKVLKTQLSLVQKDDRVKWLTFSGFLGSITAGGRHLWMAYLVEVFEWGLFFTAVIYSISYLFCCADSFHIGLYMGLTGVAAGLSK